MGTQHTLAYWACTNISYSVAAETKEVMQRIAAKPFVRRLIDQAHDQRDIEVVNLKLTDVLRVFKVVTEEQIVQDLSISEGARRNDQYQYVGLALATP